jgi:SAM-dependent methyltransferase
MPTAYSNRFYDKIRTGCQTSAQAVAPLIHNHVRPSRVVDVGCGEGWWGQAFADLGATVVGLESGEIRSAAPDVSIIGHDLTEPFPDLGHFDLAVCLEVAEHLPGHKAGHLIGELCSLAPVVLFSAAVPGQGGTGHINCQWPAYWHDLFAAQGWGVDWSMRFRVWDDDRVEPWYRQNLALAYSPDARSAVLASTEAYGDPGSAPLAIRHPDVWVS